MSLDLSVLTSAVDFSTLTIAIIQVFSALILVFVVNKAVKYLFLAINETESYSHGGFDADNPYHADNNFWGKKTEWECEQMSNQSYNE